MLLLSGIAVRAANRSVYLSGTTGGISVGNSSGGSAFDFTTGAFTLEAWIKPSTFSNTNSNVEQTILGRDSVGGAGAGYVLRTGGSRKLEFSYAYGSGSYTLATNGAVLKAGVWAHVAVVKSQGHVSLYVNGQLLRDTVYAANTAVRAAAVPLRIGENGSNSGRRFNGCVDEVKIWKAPRTTAQVRSDMPEICGAYGTDLLAYYRLDDTGSANPSTIACANNGNYNGILGQAVASQPGAVLFDGYGTLYVDSSNTYAGCGAGSGTSWATALQDFNLALDLAHTYPFIDRILVAKGTFRPALFRYDMNPDRTGTQATDPDDRKKTFHIREGLQVFGGYAPGGAVRNPYAYPTVFDGQSLVSGDSAYTVVYMDSSGYWNGVEDTTLLDGITVCDARASFTGSPLVSGAPKGGGIFIMRGTNRIDGCVVRDCQGFNGSAGIFTYMGHNYIARSRFENNSNGGAVYSDARGYFGQTSYFRDSIMRNEYGGYLGYSTHLRECYVGYNTGGGIRLAYYSHQVSGNTFAYNQVTPNSNGGTGAALMLDQTENDSVTANRFIGNNAGYAGGALYIFGGINQMVAGNLFREDTAQLGGGAYCVNTTPVFYGNRFERNYVTGGGGGLIVNGGTNKVLYNVFEENAAVGDGGGLECVNGSSDTLAGNIFVRNAAGADAGGAAVNSINCMVSDNVFAYNSGVYSAGLTMHSGGAGLVANNTFAYNRIDSQNQSQVHSVAFFISGNASVKNNLFRGNSYLGNTGAPGADYSTDNGTYDLVLTNNALQLPASHFSQGQTGYYPLGNGAADNRFGVDPQFVDSASVAGPDSSYGTQDDGLTLRGNSQLIDAGDSALPVRYRTDVIRHPRIAGATVDIGAYETTCLPVSTTSSAALSVCPGYAASLSVSSTATASDVLWYNDSTSAPVIATGYNYTTPVLFSTDTFWVRAQNCSDPRRVPVVVKVYNASPAVADVTPAGQLEICPGTSAVLSVSADVPDDSIRWYADSTSVNSLDTGYTFPTPMLFNRDTFWAEAHRCQASPRIPIVVRIHPGNGTRRTDTACVSYLWPQNGRTYTSSGSYYDTGISQYGCVRYDTLRLTVYQPVTSMFAIASCDPYFWPLTGRTYTASGTYRDTLASTHGCDSVVQLQLTISGISATIAKNGRQLTASPAGAAYRWMRCNPYSVVPGATGRTFTPTLGGSYAVEVVRNACSDTSACVPVSGVGMEEDKRTDSVRIFPNPSEGVFFMRFDIDAVHAVFTVTDDSGRKMLERTASGVRNYTLDLTDLPNGLYLLRIQTDSEVLIRRIWKRGSK